jgi:uncharacterized delta-60 repeat protein
MRNNLNNILAAAIILTAAFASTAFAQQGSLDTTFGTNNSGIFQEPLPGPTPVGADHGYINSNYGSGDASADGSVVVAGQLSSRTSNNTYFADILVRRLLPNGTPDASFGTGGYVQTVFYSYGTGYAEQTRVGGVIVKAQPDGKIVVAAQCWFLGAAPNAVGLGADVCLVRYNQNGSLDTSFGGNTIIAQYGTATTAYTFDPGKVFTITGTNSYHPDQVAGMGGYPHDLKIGADGKIYVFGSSSDELPIPGSAEGVGRPKGFVAVYSPSGALQNLNSFFDETGNVSDGHGFGDVQIYGGEVLSNGNFVAVGAKQHRTDGTNYTAAKWTIWTNSTPNGIYLDNSNGHANERALSVKLLRSNKILIGGAYGSTSPYADNQAALVRYNSDLSLDTTFGTGGIVSYDGTYRGANQVYYRRHSTAYITGIQNDGRILTGDVNDGGVWRYNPDGSPDHSIGHDFHFSTLDENSYGFVPDGNYNSPFPLSNGQIGGVAFGYPFLKPNGRIATSGCTGCGYEGVNLPRGIVSQLLAFPRSGGIFNDFDNDGSADISVFRGGDWYSLRSFNGAFSSAHFGQAGDKPAPADFDGDGRTDIAVFRDGIWYILQSSTGTFRAAQFGQAGDLPRPGDFNGDGQSDIGVFRPSTGTWYVLYSNPVQPGNVTFAAVQFGSNGDAPLLADFDGDGKSDFAVWRPSNGVWYYLRSTDGGFRAVNFGQTGDIPVAGDYDGDAKSDPAVFRPSTGVWYQLRSTTGFTAAQFGQNGDVPTPGDYDNDGRYDLAVYRSGIWYVMKSSDNSFAATNFGLPGDTPIPSAYLP